MISRYEHHHDFVDNRDIDYDPNEAELDSGNVCNYAWLNIDYTTKWVQKFGAIDKEMPSTMKLRSTSKSKLASELRLAQMEDEIQDDELSTNELDQPINPRLCLNRIPTRTINSSGRSVYNITGDSHDDSDPPILQQI